MKSKKSPSKKRRAGLTAPVERLVDLANLRQRDGDYLDRLSKLASRPPGDSKRDLSQADIATYSVAIAELEIAWEKAALERDKLALDAEISRAKLGLEREKLELARAQSANPDPRESAARDIASIDRHAATIAGILALSEARKEIPDE